MNALAKAKLVWFSTLINVVLSSKLTRSFILIRLTRLISTLKYEGRFKLFIGKLPNWPGAETPSKPGFKVELKNFPVVEFVVIFSRFGLIKKTPAGVRNTPTFFLNSSKLIPISCAGLFPELKLLNVVRPDVTKNGCPVCQTTMDPTLQPPIILSTKLFAPLSKYLPCPNGSS